MIDESSLLINIRKMNPEQASVMLVFSNYLVEMGTPSFGKTELLFQNSKIIDIIKQDRYRPPKG